VDVVQVAQDDLAVVDDVVSHLAERAARSEESDRREQGERHELSSHEFLRGSLERPESISTAFRDARGKSLAGRQVA
jgi:hypothetical protein